MAVEPSPYDFMDDAAKAAFDEDLFAMAGDADEFEDEGAANGLILSSSNISSSTAEIKILKTGIFFDAHGFPSINASCGALQLQEVDTDSANTTTNPNNRILSTTVKPLARLGRMSITSS